MNFESNENIFTPSFQKLNPKGPNASFCLWSTQAAVQQIENRVTCYFLHYLLF